MQAPRIIDLQDWFASPAGQRVLKLEQAWFDQRLANCFGFHAVQMGSAVHHALRLNRMPHRWLMLDDAEHLDPGRFGGPGDVHEAIALLQGSLTGSFLGDFDAVPLASSSVDLVVLPHTLEWAGDPHLCLREVERVLVPEGHVLIAGFNPASSWGWRQWASHRRWGPLTPSPFLPDAGEFLGPRRLRDWLKLLSFEVIHQEQGVYTWPLQSEAWHQRLGWMDAMGRRWLKPFGAVYFIHAVKRVTGMRIITPSWHKRQARQRRAVAASSHRQP